ncbi:MAG: hypothetical protein F4X35_03045 [Alphaproteobacteria bacterium]|nr:hypothetical protein [Alphaproteobacteria bacterium]
MSDADTTTAPPVAVPVVDDTAADAGAWHADLALPEDLAADVQRHGSFEDLAAADAPLRDRLLVHLLRDTEAMEAELADRPPATAAEYLDGLTLPGLPGSDVPDVDPGRLHDLAEFAHANEWTPAQFSALVASVPELVSATDRRQYAADAESTAALREHVGEAAAVSEALETFTAGARLLGLGEALEDLMLARAYDPSGRPRLLIEDPKFQRFLLFGMRPLFGGRLGG